MRTATVALTSLLLVGASWSLRAGQNATEPAAREFAAASSTTLLLPTSHPPLPSEPSRLWLAPARGTSPRRVSGQSLRDAVRLEAAGEHAKALAIVEQPTMRAGILAQYAIYYTGLAQLGAGSHDDALKTFSALRLQKPVGYLAEAIVLGEAAAREAAHNYAEAVWAYERLLATNPTNLDDVLMRMGRAARSATAVNKAAAAFQRVYYDFPLGEQAADAETELARFRFPPLSPASPRYPRELGRAVRLFDARQYGPACEAFERLAPVAADVDRAFVELRLAECAYTRRRFADARLKLRPFLVRSPRQGEALFYYAEASRELRDDETYRLLARRLVEELPRDRWAVEALNSLATYYVRRNEDDQADVVFRELLAKYPASSHAERAAWKVGWRAYRQGRYEEAARVFESGAASAPRSDYRPSWIYWAGRAYEQLGVQQTADERYALAIADYQNSYYGRLALGRLGRRPVVTPVPPTDTDEDDIHLPAELPQTAELIRALLGEGLYEDALRELRFAQKHWGDSAALQATVAWVNQQLSLGETGTRRFQLSRGAINTMRRAYPHFMATGGEELPKDVLSVIYPMAYWELIRKYSAANRLDPFLVAALVAQESTFVPDIRSSANAYGLMQLLPSTARSYARKLRVPYSMRLLTNPEANVRLGTAYLADKIREFGDPYLALASYNAGESAVRRWLAERPRLDRDEFIDDIPYPETQNYVKRILGTAEDYRRLYGHLAAN